MKRKISIVMCLCLLIGLCSCTADPIPTEVIENGEMTEDLAATQNIIHIPQVGEFAESILMKDVPGQGSAVLLSMRSDGTVDYIFCDRTRLEIWNEGIQSVKEAGFQYYTVSPDGTDAEQPTQWIDQLDEAMQAANAEADTAKRWRLNFSAWEGNVLIYAQLSDFQNVEAEYSALYRIYDGELTQIPFRWEFDWQGARVRIPQEDGVRFFAIENGFLLETVNDVDADKDGYTDGQLYYAFSYDGTAQSCTVVDDEDMKSHIAIEGGTGWFMPYTRNKIVTMDMRSGTRLMEQSAVVENVLARAAKPDGSALYMLCSNYDQTRIYLNRVTAEGMENVIEDSSLYAFGDGAYIPSDMVVDNEGNFYTVTEGSNGSILRQYRYNPDGAREVEYLTIYSLEDNQTIRTAVTRWNQTHGDIHCKYIVAEEEIAGTMLTLEDAITQLNTQLVNGEGPDVLILDGLPVDSLMDKGFLEPLNELDTAGVYLNLLERFTLYGDLYAVPAKMIPYLLGRITSETESIDSLEEFADIVEFSTDQLTIQNIMIPDLELAASIEKSYKEALYFVENADQVFDLWYPAWENAIWAEGFDAERYQEFLTHTGRLVAHYSLQTVDAIAGEYGEDEWMADIGATRDTYTIINATDANYKPSMEMYPYPYCLAATSYVGMTNFFYSVFEMPWDAETVSCEFTGIPGPDGIGVTVPKSITALRAGGNTADGLEFIRLLLSEGIQSDLPGNHYLSMDGYPVKWSCSIAALDNMKEMNEQDLIITNDFEAALNGLRCVVIDQVLYDAAKEAALRYYEGKLTAQEAAEQVQSAAALYLAEQR